MILRIQLDAYVYVNTCTCMSDAIRIVFEKVTFKRDLLVGDNLLTAYSQLLLSHRQILQNAL